MNNYDVPVDGWWTPWPCSTTAARVGVFGSTGNIGVWRTRTPSPASSIFGELSTVANGYLAAGASAKTHGTADGRALLDASTIPGTSPMSDATVP